MCLLIKFPPGYIHYPEEAVFGKKRVMVMREKERTAIMPPLIWNGSYSLTRTPEGLSFHMRPQEQTVEVLVPGGGFTLSQVLGLHISPLFRYKLFGNDWVTYLYKVDGIPNRFLGYFLDMLEDSLRLDYAPLGRATPKVNRGFLVGTLGYEIEAIGSDIVVRRFFIPDPEYWEPLLYRIAVYTLYVIGRTVEANIEQMRDWGCEVDKPLQTFKDQWDTYWGEYYLLVDSPEDIKDDPVSQRFTGMLKDIFVGQWKWVQENIDLQEVDNVS